MTEPNAPSSAPSPAPVPPGGWRVRILDLSGGAEDGILEEVGGFPSLMHANEFARRYVRDSLERCRAGAPHGQAVIENWQTFGEDAIVLPEQPESWRSARHLADFAAKPATSGERDWRVLDPRRIRSVASPRQGTA